MRQSTGRRTALAPALAMAIATASPAVAGERVGLDVDVAPGSLLIRTSERALYLALGDGSALRYRVAVGRPGKQWHGEAFIDGKYVEPAWSPPAEVKRDNPRLPKVIAGGSSRNPMGARALTLDRGQYAIHGSSPTMRASIGTFASYGCIRMLNEDIVDLYPRVKVGARVVVVP